MTTEKKLRMIDWAAMLLWLWWLLGDSWIHQPPWIGPVCAMVAFALFVWGRMIKAKAIKSGEIPPPPEVDLKPYFARLLALAAAISFGVPLVEIFFTSQHKSIGESLVIGAVMFLILGVTFWAATHPEKAGS